MVKNTKLTKSVQKKICDALEIGHSLSTAAAMAKVSARFARRWQALGREEEIRIGRGLPADPEKAIYLEFFLATEEAVAFAVDKYLKILMTGNANESKKAERILTRCFPGKWGEKYQMQERIEELEELTETLINNGKGTNDYHG